MFELLFLYCHFVFNSYIIIVALVYSKDTKFSEFNTIILFSSELLPCIVQSTSNGETVHLM